MQSVTGDQRCSTRSHQNLCLSNAASNVSQVTSAPTISDVIATRVRAVRKRQELTLAQLAAECARLGAPQLSLSALANIERGQTAPSTRKRRDVSPDELVVLACALRVPPVSLLFAVEADDQTEMLPGRRMDARAAARWFGGEAPLPDEDSADWETGAAPLILLRRHERHLRDWRRAPGIAAQLVADVSDAAETQRLAGRLRTFVAADLRRCRDEMRRRGLALPELPEHLAPIDDNGYGRPISTTDPADSSGL